MDLRASPTLLIICALFIHARVGSRANSPTLLATQTLSTNNVLPCSFLQRLDFQHGQQEPFPATSQQSQQSIGNLSAGALPRNFPAAPAVSQQEFFPASCCSRRFPLPCASPKQEAFPITSRQPQQSQQGSFPSACCSRRFPQPSFPATS